MADDTDLPSVLASVRRSFGLAYEAEPRLLVVSSILTVASFLPSALIAFWLRLLADGVVRHRFSEVVIGVAAMALSVTATWLLNTVGGRMQRVFSQRATIALEARVAELQTRTAGIEHHERPEYLDRLQLLRDQVFLLNHLYMSVTMIVGLVLRLALTVGLLASISPLLVGLAVFALPVALSATWRAGVERAAQEGAASSKRLARHLFDIGTTAGPGKEVRLSGIGPAVVGWHDRALQSSVAPLQRARWQSSAWHAAAWTVFGAAYVAAVAWAALGLRAPAGSVLLVLAAGGNLSAYLAQVVSSVGFTRWCIDAAQRLLWLERYATGTAERATEEPPARLREGMRLEGVTFRYPGTDRDVLEDVDLTLPAGRVVALVGENGAGKSTLVKLLCRFYAPTRGRITIDGVDLARIPAAEWRKRLTATFQDFMRFEFRVGRSIGLGDVEREEDRAALLGAASRGGAADVVERLPRGLETQLGPTWAEGVDLSFGQWQKVAVARAFMRSRPLLMVLDEPTAALDAETEHALFERFAAESRAAAADGRITVLVSHRFSTVRMADLIVVLDGARVVEVGSHEELMRRRGTYSELYGIQARGYR
ncbi:MAG TPA: ABC transporter ATP-binding protein [Candidatus Dormibacteraeota bacterium]|jgi:ATP-binding cassette subfamily B protein|nr:ABC transporter ATP-binding protein [Candidatus Dormibacteraeota bacterium]